MANKLWSWRICESEKAERPWSENNIKRVRDREWVTYYSAKTDKPLTSVREENETKEESEKYEICYSRVGAW